MGPEFGPYTVPMVGGPMAGAKVCVDSLDALPKRIVAVGLVPSRNLVPRLTEPPADYQWSVYELVWCGEHYEEPEYRWPAPPPVPDAPGWPRSAERLPSGLREELIGVGHPAWQTPLRFEWGVPREEAAKWLADNRGRNPEVTVRARLVSEWSDVEL